MTIKHDSIKRDDQNAAILFDVEIDGKPITVIFSDIFFQECFNCCDPEVEFKQFIIDQMDSMSKVIMEKYAQGNFPAGSKLYFNDL